MIVRIVRMEFKPDKTEAFLRMFKNTYPLIRNFEGCTFLELYRDSENPNCYYTVSKWVSEEKLEMYRLSNLFKETWAVTKTFFGGPPLAYSLNKEVNDSINPF